MQLGTSWTAGTPVPGSVPVEFAAKIVSTDASYVANGLDISRIRWTLTWLEQKPRAERDDGVRIHQLSDDTIVEDRWDND